MGEQVGIELTFGAALHGWLPVTLRSGESVLSFEASDVPRDPVLAFSAVLIELCSGRQGEVDWWLEPAWYRFKLLPLGDRLQLEVLFSEWDWQTDWRKVVEYNVDLISTVDHLIRAVLTHIEQVDPEQWYSYDDAVISSLKDALSKT